MVLGLAANESATCYGRVQLQLRSTFLPECVSLALATTSSHFYSHCHDYKQPLYPFRAMSDDDWNEGDTSTASAVSAALLPPMLCGHVQARGLVCVYTSTSVVSTWSPIASSNSICQ